MACANDYVIKLGLLASPTEIAGQMDGTMTVGGTRIENTNKSNGGGISYVANCIAGKQVVFAGNFTFVDDAAQNTIKQAIEDGVSIECTVFGYGTESWEGLFAVAGRADNAGTNSDSTWAVTFSSDASNGLYVYTPATDPT